MYHQRFLGYLEAFQINKFQASAGRGGGGELTFHSAHQINKATLVVWVYMWLRFEFNNLYVSTANDLIT
jgi:hypothetical protein